MQPIYTNSKGEPVVIAEMELPHLLFAMCKLSRSLGDPDLDAFSKDQKTNEVKNMHENVLRRFAEANGEND